MSPRLLDVELRCENARIIPIYNYRKGQTLRFNSGSKCLILLERVLPNYERKQRDLKFEVAGCDRLGMKRDEVCGSKCVGGSECVYTRNDVDRTVPGKVVERRISLESHHLLVSRFSFNFLTRYVTGGKSLWLHVREIIYFIYNF